MKKEDQLQQNNEEELEPTFEDSRYQIDMRVDPLNTMDQIKRDLIGLKQKADDTAAILAAQAAEKESEQKAQEEYEASLRINESAAKIDEPQSEISRR